MRVSFVTSGLLNNVWQESLDKISNSDVVAFGFNGLGLVSYKKELSGESEYFHDLASLSKQLSCTVISGCDTDTYGIFRHSAVIADRGRILGVSDAVHSVEDSEFVSGGSLRVYETSAGKIGILVGLDMTFLDTSSTLAKCDADFIICILKKVDSFMPNVLLRALSFTNGVAMGLVAKNYSALSDIRGEIVSASSADIVSKAIKIEKNYHEISIKRRGALIKT